MAQRCLEAGLPFDVGEQGELQAPALHRRAPRQRRPGRDDFIDTQRAAQPVQAVPHRWIDLVGAALQPPLPAPRIHAPRRPGRQQQEQQRPQQHRGERGTAIQQAQAFQRAHAQQDMPDVQGQGHSPGRSERCLPLARA
ncbi:hypothetical protein G6F57_018380 [Rhizopus arrhizus]|nr:hypothetical protein G6F57_018380 [Rhizopus arrhizus]